MSAVAESRVIAGKYRLIRPLGRGGMGAVWYAEHLSLNSPVAVKLIEASIATDPGALARFLREAQSAAALRSPHVVQILDYGVDGAAPYIVMEVLDGESLAERLQRFGSLSPQETARIVTHVGRAITRAHELHVVHRDLKPDNIFIVKNDEEEIAKVLDFGIAKSENHDFGTLTSGHTRTGAVLGTPYYMSPEQAEGIKSLDYRTDIWALGVIACECLTGRKPFEAETLGGLLMAICARPLPLPSRLGSVPPGFDAWFARACARNVDERYASAKQLAQELRQVCGDQSSSLQQALPGFGTLEHPGFEREPFAQSADGLSSTLGAGSAADNPFADARRQRKKLLIGAGITLSLVLGFTTFALTRSPSGQRPALTPSASNASGPVPVERAPLTEAAAIAPRVEPLAVAPEPFRDTQLEGSDDVPSAAVATATAAPSSMSPKKRRRPAAAPGGARRDQAKEPSPSATPTAEQRVNLGI